MALTIVQKAQKLIGSGKTEPEKIKAEIAAVQQRARELDARYNEIKNEGDIGAERIRVEREGTPQQLLDLDKELELLLAEQLQTARAERELFEALDAAERAAAPGLAKAAAKRLPGLLDRIEAARRELEAAGAAIDDALSPIARATVLRVDGGPWLAEEVWQRLWGSHLSRAQHADIITTQRVQRLRLGLKADLPGWVPKLETDDERIDRRKSEFWAREHRPGAAFEEGDDAA